MNRAWKRALRKKYRTLQVYGAAGVAGAAAIGVVGVTNQGTLGENATTTSTLSRLPQLASPIASPHGNPGSAANIAAQEALHVSSVVSDAKRTFASRFAGAWIDNSGKSPVTRIMVAGSPNASTERLFQGRLALSVATKTKVSYVKYTMAQLDAYKKTIVDYVASHFKTPAYRPSGEMIFYIDTKDNSVGIGLTHQDVRFLAELQKLIPSDALRVQWIRPAPKPTLSPNTASQPAGGPGLLPGVNRNSVPFYKAGLGPMQPFNDGPAQCTTGFTLRGPFYNTYKYYGVTAGHCAHPMDQINYTNGTMIGIGTRVYSYGTGGDYYAFVLTKPYQSSYKAKGTILAETKDAGTFGFIDNVVGRASNNDQWAGRSVCASGYITNEITCGTIGWPPGTDVWVGMQYFGTLVGNLACASFTINPGDSGGAVYVPKPGNAGKAAGVIDNTTDKVGAVLAQPSYGHGSCYTTIDSVLQGISAHNQGVPAYVVDANGTFS